MNRRSVPFVAENDEIADREIQTIFGDNRAPVATKPNMADFISKTARSKIAIVIPMFGYYQDVKDGFFDEDVLDAVTERARSYIHNAYVIMLAEPARLPAWSAKILNSKYVAGNVRGVAMPNGSSYGDYLRKGMQVALTETDAAFIVFHNPWVVIQDHGIDTMIDRVNIADNAPVICGYEMNDTIVAEKFLDYKVNVPMEKTMLSFNFIGMNRFIAEMCPIDPAMRTQPYLERDFFQNVASKGYSAVSSERVPMFSFDVPWDKYVPSEQYSQDAQIFFKKWKFMPDDLSKKT